MAKIERKNLKIFAKDAANNGQFGSAQVGTKVTTQDPETVQALDAWNQGWINSVIGGSKLPPLEELQSTTFVPTYHLAYIFQEGVPEWNAETTYYIGSWVKSGGTIYKSLTDDNLNNAIPDAVNWAILEATASDYGMVKRSSDFEATASDYGMVKTSSLFAIGSIQQSILSLAQFQTLNGTDWVLMDGADITGSALATLTGTTTVPDSTGCFLRNAGGNAGAIGVRQADATAVNGLKLKPTNDYISTPKDTSPSYKNLTVNYNNAAMSTNSGFWTLNTSAFTTGQWPTNEASRAFLSNVNTIDSTDGETRPINIAVNYFIKIN